jgi:hypothetical protein
MWQWPTGAWDGTEPNAAAVADQYTIATRRLGARARCHHEQRHVPPWQQLPFRPYTTQAKEASHGASPRRRCRVVSWERPLSGMSAEIANDRLWPKADIHNSKTIAPIRQPSILALSLSQPRSGCAPSAGHGEGMDTRVEATQGQLPDGPPLYPGPLCGGESGRSPASAKRGCSFLLVTSLLLRAFCPSPFGPASLFAHASCVHVDKQRRSNSASTGGRKLFALNAEADKRIARERAPARGRDVK